MNAIILLVQFIIKFLLFAFYFVLELTAKQMQIFLHARLQVTEKTILIGVLYFWLSNCCVT